MFTMEMGQVWVQAEEGKGHSVEFFADRIVDRLIYVSDEAPDPIKAQALAYKDSMREIIIDGLKRAIASDRAYRSF